VINIAPGAAQPGSWGLAHELGHVFQNYTFLGRSGVGMTDASAGTFWETSAEFMAMQVYPDTAAGDLTRFLRTEKIVNSWQGGFQSEVTVTAGSSTISGWTVNWTFLDGQTVTQSWNVTLTSSGANVTASNAGYNATVNAGASTTFGFIGTSGSANRLPTVTCTAR
jgi:cellulase/cellobiase CelA1